MANIGTIAVNTHRILTDQVLYAQAANTVSHVDTVALKGKGGNARSPLKMNVYFQRGFAATTGTESEEKLVTVSIATVVPPGVDTEAVKAYVTECLTQSAVTAADVAVTGDIML